MDASVSMAEELVTTTEKQEGTSRRRRGLRLRTLNAFMVLLAATVAIIFLQAVRETNETYTTLEQASDNYIHCESAASEMKAGSNYLTIQVRTFVVTQDLDYLDNYFWEADENRRRERSVETLEELQENESANLKMALSDSVELMDLEYYAMKLVVEAKGYDNAKIHEHLDKIVLSPKDAVLSPDAKIERATSLVFGNEYMDYVSRIEGDVAKCKEDLIAGINAVQSESRDTLHALLLKQQVLSVALFAIFIAMTVSIVVLVLWPLRAFGNHIRNNDSLPATGADELRRMADAYNLMYEENMKNHDILRKKAEHDHLTGLYNRSVFERLLELHANEHYALMLVDADHFKEVNDSLGHDVGDAILQKVARLLNNAFRTSDYPCRIGGDEFAVFMSDIDEELGYVVETKARRLLEGLLDTSDGLPALTLSIGIAFNDGTLSGEQVFKHADQALYKVKEAGRNGFRFYSD